MALDVEVCINTNDCFSTSVKNVNIPLAVGSLER